MIRNRLIHNLEGIAESEFCKNIQDLDIRQLHYALGKAIMFDISGTWRICKEQAEYKRRVFYFSAEFLMGRMIHNNLYALRIYDKVKKLLLKRGIDINSFEDIEDVALGNGGLGRLAACFLDSAATQGIPLDGYGILYKDGLFKQIVEDGFQVEVADDWQKNLEPFCLRRDDQSVLVKYEGQTVRAVPYDMAVIGYGGGNINTLRLWKSEPVNEFDFTVFNDQDYNGAVQEKNDAENITRVLYPDDSNDKGKLLRLKQQYFFCSASIQDIIRRYKQNHKNFNQFSEKYRIQLNDTHPVIAIPELIRLLIKNGLDFGKSLSIAKEVFSYTNHTVMQEAFEKWDADIFKEVLPEVYSIIERIDKFFIKELLKREIPFQDIDSMQIIKDNKIHMANMAVYVSSFTNGVSRIHTQIIKTEALHDFFKYYPKKFQNKTNGVTQRRWLGLCNPEYSKLISDLISSKWLTDFSRISDLKLCISQSSIQEFNKIKRIKKEQLCEYIKKVEGVELDPSFIFDVQIKRLHEYKRQLLNAFAIVDIYLRLKSGELIDINKTAFIFGAKAASGYLRAKGIIKYINEIAKKINDDPFVNNKLKVIFVTNYNCSYAEKIIPAADISEQISTAGTEASGTSNMKFMMNGCVTLGTYDGSNIEIFDQAGFENNYMFGAKNLDLSLLKKDYNPNKIYNDNIRIKRVVDTLIDGTFDDGGTGMFKDIYESILGGDFSKRADKYFILRDFDSYVNKKLEAISNYSNRISFGKKCLFNSASSRLFSSDRAVNEYAKEIWEL